MNNYMISWDKNGTFHSCMAEIFHGLSMGWEKWGLVNQAISDHRESAEGMTHRVGNPLANHRKTSMSNGKTIGKWRFTLW